MPTLRRTLVALLVMTCTWGGKQLAVLGDRSRSFLHWAVTGLAPAASGALILAACRGNTVMWVGELR